MKLPGVLAAGTFSLTCPRQPLPVPLVGPGQGQCERFPRIFSAQSASLICRPVNTVAVTFL